ncbi:apolipoprotein N-acyltransferase [Hyphomicrobium denitrificans 1NES1]|uniref:Apolipoprotein N-acyltransferase n=1 Tax=Hyphomicrobium denitrificans 1NES1 TaxID=670307 RepID=N0BCN0_9HYPH|nr:apolipoprotein N-acyltransferase [Hyphomicrobium denitrificans]AGK59977.1 apolipoprotein N-acyltransferase [Hyphomicrobium denitrificans 1NES1]
MDAQSQTLPVPTLAALRSRVMGISGWRRAVVAIGAGGLSALAFAPIFAFPVLFLTFPVFVWLIDASPGWRRAASAGWLFGFGYFFFNLFWVGEAFLVEADKFAWLLPFAVMLLPAGLALFWAAAAAVARAFWLQGLGRVFVFAIALAVFEWLRGHILTGFPWNVVGYALTYPLPLMQSAALFGAYGLTAIAVFIFPAPLVMMADRKERLTSADIARASAVAAIPIAALCLYGGWRLSVPEAFVPDVKLRIVQPSVPQREKWMAEYQRRIFDDHIALSLANPKGEKDSLAGITHLVWPEAAMPFFPLETPEALDILSAMLPPGTTLITGAIRHDPPLGADRHLLPTTKTLNSILVLNEQAQVEAIYDKIKLVPFGEYVPLESALSHIGIEKLTHGRGAFAEGVSPRPLMTIPGLPPALGLVCYEALFSGDIVQSSARPGVLLNVTNDGWFGQSTGPYQHFHQARIRAVEEGVPLIRAANNGISAIVDPYGRALQTLGLDVRDVIDSRLPQALRPTVYARAGDWMLVLVLTVFAALAVILPKLYR